MCGERICGRSDKIYCSDYCRSVSYQNTHAPTIQRIRNINYILRRNRTILSKLYQEGVRRISKEALAAAGINLRYCTHHHENRGVMQWYCYDRGFENIERNEVKLLVVEEDEITCQDFC